MIDKLDVLAFRLSGAQGTNKTMWRRIQMMWRDTVFDVDCEERVLIEVRYKCTITGDRGRI